jgi:hypothetical protein
MAKTTIQLGAGWERFDWFVQCGKKLGYPHCCVANFVQRVFVKNQLTVYQDMIFHLNEGFVPCPKHAKQLLEGVITYDKLLKRRIVKTKFPNHQF